MSLGENDDFILVKQAGYRDGRITLNQLGNLIVTRNWVILRVLQTIDSLEALTNEGSGSIKEDWKDTKKSFKAIGDYGRGEKEIRAIAEQCDSIEEFEREMLDLSEAHEKSLRLRRDKIESWKAGWLGPITINMEDGTSHRLNTLKKKQIKAMLEKGPGQDVPAT